MNVWIRKRTTKDGTVTFHGRWKDEAGEWHSKKLGTDPDKAKDRAGRLANQLERGETGAVKRRAWTEFVDEHCTAMVGDNRSPEYIARNRQVLTEFGEQVDVHRVADLTRGKVEAWLGKLTEAKQEPGTRRSKLIVLKSALNRAVERGYLFHSPAAKVKGPEADDSRPCEITEDEERAILAECDKRELKRLASFVRLAIGTGCRRNELLFVRWENIDLERGELHLVKTKSRRNRCVPLRPDLVAELRRMVPATQQVGGPFRNLAAKTMNYQFRAVADAVGLPDITPHSCRDTFITRMLRGGAALHVVSRLAGHSNITITARYYAAITDADLRNAVNLLKPVATAG